MISDARRSAVPLASCRPPPAHAGSPWWPAHIAKHRLPSGCLAVKPKVLTRPCRAARRASDPASLSPRPKSIVNMFRCAAVGGTRPGVRNDVARFFEATAPADLAGRADTKMLGACRQDKPPAIAAITLWRRSTEAPWPSMLTSFASMQLEAELAPFWEFNDSFRSENALAVC